jgi:chromosome segregation ATPase
MSLIVVTVLLGIALVVSLAANMGFFGAQKAHGPKLTSAPENAPRALSEASSVRANKLESELDKRRKELEELKKSQAELKDELKTAKKKLHDYREAERAGDDLVKARAEVERQASIQLDATRQELSNALAEVQRLRNELEARGKRKVEERKTEEKPEDKKEPAPVQRVIRELSEAEKEKIQRLEQQAAMDKRKAIEVAAELRNVKARVEREKREARRVYEDGKLARDKFRAVEIRLNRTLLENDLLKRAIVDLEKKTGAKAEKTSLTSEELAQSDRTMREKHAAEDRAAEEARAKLEAAEATPLEPSVDAPPATGAITPTGTSSAESPAPSSPPSA